MTYPDLPLSRPGPFRDISIPILRDQIRLGEVSSLELVDRAVNASQQLGAELNCFVTIDGARARDAARMADAELAKGLDRGPLHGIPVGIKDIIDTSGLRTTMGSRHYASNIPIHDADVVLGLRRAGAVIVGKTHTHEFAYGPTGDCAASGAVINPYDRLRMAGGSSGGSAVAVAAGLVPLAIGTDTAGSIRIPAALCGVVGLRPTTGTISGKGVFPLAPTFDSVGPIAASSTDVAIAWGVMAEGSRTSQLKGNDWKPWTGGEFAAAQTLRFRLVDCQAVSKLSNVVSLALQEATGALCSQGVDVSSVRLPELDDCAEVFRVIQSAEASFIHSERMRSAPDLYQPEVSSRLHEASQVRAWEYIRALGVREQLLASVERRLEGVDILLMPTVPIDAPMLGERGPDPAGHWETVRAALLSMNVPWSLLGYPAISVPVNIPDTHLPQSIQFIGKPGRELEVLAAAGMLEKALTTT